jgi:hypothetical protein
MTSQSVAHIVARRTPVAQPVLLAAAAASLFAGYPVYEYPGSWKVGGISSSNQTTQQRFVDSLDDRLAVELASVISRLGVTQSELEEDLVRALALERTSLYI